MRPDGSDERLLTRSTLDEGPAWAPNGRVIVFSRKDYGSDRTRLFTIDVTGYNERELPTPLVPRIRTGRTCSRDWRCSIDLGATQL